MIEFIFTVDYEIYGNGSGSLEELIFNPSESLINIFSKNEADLVFFIEVAELEMIEATGSDPAIRLIKNQIKQICQNNFEIGLHIHPQWYKARLKNGQWILNYDEYNLCLLSEDRINQLVNRAISYLRYLVEDSSFTPIAYRAGNWLMTPTEKMGRVLATLGIKIDSSVFKGGYQHSTGLDYRQAPPDLFYWKFSKNVIQPDPNGVLLEIPIYTKMIPTWKFISRKRIGMEKKAVTSNSLKNKMATRIHDFLRFKVPMKFDFCRLRYDELKSLTDELIKIDALTPAKYKPIVLIGHTKDSPDYDIITRFLYYLNKKNIRCSSFNVALKELGRRKI